MSAVKTWEFLVKNRNTCSSLLALNFRQKCCHNPHEGAIFSLKNYQSTSKPQVRCYWVTGAGDNRSVSKAVSDAEKIVGYPTSFLSLRCLLSDEMSNVALHMRKLVGTKHPVLKTARRLVFDGKHNLQMRGLLVLLISKAAGPNPQMDYSQQDMISGVHSSQRSLAEITEVIYTANLIHKGVVDLDLLHPEDGPRSDMEFGNKLAILSGDYLLASACTGLAKLENPMVIDQVASSIRDMMTAEFTDYAREGQRSDPGQVLAYWLRLTYLSVGSLLAKSCQSAMTLVGHSKDLESRAFSFGENTSYAQQLRKDLLPFIQQEELSSLSQTSAPVFLYKEKAGEEEIQRLDQLWRDGPTSFRKIVAVISESGVLEHCKELCSQYRDKAIASLDCYPDSDAKAALVNMVTAVSDVR